MSYGNTYTNRKQFRATQSVMSETPVYPEMFSRTFNNNIQDESVIEEIWELNNINGINRNSMAQIASDIIRPSGTPSGRVNIDYGFGERRILFMISVEVPAPSGSVPWVTILTGYTDYSDYSLITQSLPDDMRMYIDNVQTINKGTGFARVTDSSHILSSRVMDSIDFLDTETEQTTISDRNGYVVQPSMRLIRPQDVLSDISSGIYALSQDTDAQVLNPSATLSRSRNVKNRRSNGLASRYLNDLLKPAIETEEDSLFRGASDTSRYDSARVSATTREPSISSDLFLRHLKAYDNFVDSGYLTWGELRDLIPNLESITRLSTVGNSPSITGHQARIDDTESWQAATMEAIAATTINSSIGAIMTSCLITSADITFSNESLDNSSEMTVVPESVTVFDPDLVDARLQLNMLNQLIINELIPIVTHGGRHTIAARVIYEMHIDCHITVSWDGGDFVPFVTPTFCDGLFSPMLTANQETVDAFSNNTANLIEGVVRHDFSNGVDYGY